MLIEGMEAGRSAQSLARDIVGRTDRLTKRREGGIIGLTRRQAEAVTRVRAELSDERISAYLQRKRRDKRFDRLLQRVLDGKEKLSAPDIDRIVGRYADRLLLLRGETIARTETLAAHNNASDDAIRQLVDQGIAPSRIKRRWKTASDRKVRDSHRAIHNELRVLGEPFSNGLLFPHAPGAPASEVVACRCITQPEVEFI